MGGGASPAARLILPLAVFVGSFALYLITLARDLLPADNGEFQLVAATLGVAHPPGYPLHTLLGALLARIPLGTIPWRVNLLSALLAAGTLALVFATARRVAGGRVWAGVTAALALGTSTTFWAQATMSNVRTPAAFFAALCLYVLVRHREAGPQTDRWLLLFAAALTLGLTHHLSLAFAGLFFILFLWLIDPQLPRQPRRWARPALVALLCLLPLVYLPLRAGAPLAPADIDAWGGFWRHVLALGFSGDFFFFSSPADLLARLPVMGNVFTFQFHPLVLAAGVLGALLLLWRDRPLAVPLLGGLALHTLVTATYRAPQTVEYMLPAYVLFAVTLGYGLGQLANLQAKGRQLQAVGLALAALVWFAGLLQGVQHFASFRALAQSRDARDYAASILDGAPQGAIVLADWHWAMPLRYLQLVEGAWPDLTVQYVAPTAELYEQTWARRIREELPVRPVVVTHFHELAYADLPAVVEPLGEAFWLRTESRQALPADFIAADIAFGDGLRLLGYQLNASQFSADAPLILTLAWSPVADALQVTLFVHLVGYDGAVYAQQDVRLEARLLEPNEVALTRFQLEVRPGALPGRYSLHVGAYAAGGPLPDASGRTRTELLGVELAPAGSRPFTRHPRQRQMAEELYLIGADWDLTLPDQPRLYLHWRARGDTDSLVFEIRYDSLPVAQAELPALPAGSYQTTVHSLPPNPFRPYLAGRKTARLPAPAGTDQYLPFGAGIVYLGYDGPHDSPPANPQLRFAASRPVLRDYVVSTSLIGVNPDGSWAWRELNDGVPALGAIPTLKWVAGSRVADPHMLAVPAGAPAGRVIGTLTLYDAFTGRTLPLLDERLAAAAPWAPLGEWFLGP